MVERILLDACINALGKVDFHSQAVLSPNEKLRLDSPHWASIIKNSNVFLTETHHFSPMPSLRLEFTANGGLLLSKGTAGMLKSKDMVSVLTVLPFAGMIFDSFLGPDAQGHFTKIMTLHTTISQNINGHFVD